MTGRALQIFNHDGEPFGFMIQCPKCLWWSNSPRWHASTCQFRDLTMESIDDSVRRGADRHRHDDARDRTVRRRMDAMKFVVIVFFDMARTEFIVHGPFNTYDDAQVDANATVAVYAPGAFEAIEIAVLVEPKRNPK